MATGPLGSVVGRLRRLAERGEAAARTDRELLARFVAARDEAAFAELVRRHGPVVLGVCRRVVRDAHAAEDAFQAVFFVLARKAGAVGRPELLGNWLYGVACRVSLKARADVARRRAREQAACFVRGAGPSEGSADELQAAVCEEVHRLPGKYRDPVVLCYFRGYTHEEAADDLGWPVGTVKGHLARARQLLRRRLTRRGLVAWAAPFTAASWPGWAGAIPDSLFNATVPGALAFRPGSAAVLATEVMRAMIFAKLKTALVLTLTIGVLGAGLRLLPGRPAAAVAAPESVALRLPVDNTLPEGWGGGSSQPGQYEIGQDQTVFRGGKASGVIKATADAPQGFGTLTQTCKADDYRGKRLRLSGYVKVKDADAGAGLWLRVDSANKTQAFDNMQGRSVKDTADWAKYEIVVDVPADAAYLTFGMLLNGKGAAWVDDLKFETVGDDVKTTNTLEQPIDIPQQEFQAPAKPVNLDFEAAGK
jgi:RNA polymerase sigma factor (sigma-70 family)